jgi:hypothetical protein
MQTRNRDIPARIPLIFTVILLLPASAGAHRLDEYLQATRIGVEWNRISLEIDLTPGVSLASDVTSWIDTNGDQAISTTESMAYGQQVLRSLTLSVDGNLTPIQLIEVQAPPIPDMAAGVGTFRVRATASIPPAATGRHQLTLINTHHPESSVYLANALVPADTAIRILAQNRTNDQHWVTIDYELGRTVNWTRFSWLLGAGTLLSGAALARRGLGHSSGR